MIFKILRGVKQSVPNAAIVTDGFFDTVHITKWKAFQLL